MATVDEIEAALKHLDSENRDQWVRIGASIKTELGDDGFTVWDNWSQTGSNYVKNDAKDVWKSLKAGKVNIGTLFYEARRSGYRPNKPFRPPSQAEQEARRQAQEASRIKAEQERAKEMADAVAMAKNQWSKAEPLRKLSHAYLVDKGIEDRVLVRQLRQEGTNLLLPVKKNGQIVGLQTINTSGQKLFTKGMELKGGSLVIGSWSNVKDKGVVLAEGYATAASIHKATGLTTIVCFVGNNLASVAERLPKNELKDVPIIIAADHDKEFLNKTTGQYYRPGMEYAKAAKEVLGDNTTIVVPQFTEQDVNTFQQLYKKDPSDFNDLHKLQGLKAVQQQFQQREINMSQATSSTPPANQAEAVQSENEEVLERTPEPELENSFSPDFDRIIQTQENQQEKIINIPSDLPEKERISNQTFEMKNEHNPRLVLDLDYEHPPGQLKAKYVCSFKGDYLDKEGVVQFKDKGAKLTTPKSDNETIRDMLAVAEIKGWNHIKVSGDKEFRQAVFLEANSRGIAVEGYKPTVNDMARLEQMREDKAKNLIEKSASAQTPSVSEAHIHSEKDKLLKQNTAPPTAQIETSAKVDVDSDISMRNVGGQEIQSELKAFAQYLTPKQQGLDKASLAKLQSFKAVAKMMVAGLKREDRQTAIKNFNENMDKAINGNTLNIPSFLDNQKERSTHKPTQTLETRSDRQQEELTR